MRTFSVRERRDLMVRRHQLTGDAFGPDEVVASLIALHATDPASVYLSVLARSARSSLADVSAAMYEEKRLVRWMAMRRTLFVFPTVDVPLIQAAVSTPLAAVLGRQLASRIRRNGTEPEIEGDAESWLTDVGFSVQQSLQALGAATGARLSAEVPALRTTIRPGAPSERQQNVTSPLLTIMGTQGRIVRGRPTGPWTSRHHSWEPVEHWWPEGLPRLDRVASQQTLALRWLERFGPATVDDLQWWTGWTKTTAHQALSALPLADVDLHGRPGIALRDQVDTPRQPAHAPVATLLPSLDATPMGWKHRAWFLGIEPRQIFDTAGNIGPTIWWDGEIIGSWAVAATGEVRTALAIDKGAEAVAAVDSAAAQLNRRLDGVIITPAIRTPLERSLL
jgi:hypothetical protein